ncbi:D-2-hydroxyacid dehydrogenase [Mangrovimicrobium sediminis]|uniref:D-2-hydroxyacid dehydrogenase n=1 Tax=Mangrovimicrobium sediminis TaxID=2562682 RepID=A0A4Z0M5S0_9GAMM|nr:D-2-hydroxyacid dehydrogenase [Haliea sp. SAOS-164]TGD74718.1 D-2-hydroxyacid dehydrogenase [Haliea sp. SAOS-164]
MPKPVQAIIDARSLDTADTPLREIPGWAPRKVVVMAPGSIAAAVPDFRAGFTAAAGDLELVFDAQMGADPGVLAGADAVIGLCTPEVFAAAGDSLFWLHSYSVGVDRCLGLDDAVFAGKVFSNSKRLSAPAIAEHAIAMLLSLARGLPDYHAAQLRGAWEREIAEREHFGELAGKTLLVAGLGGIGTEVASRAHGLGMRVIATRNSSREGPDYVDYVGLADELDTLAAEADVVVNALPLTDSTQGLFDKEFFGKLRGRTIFISVGRGATTVTADLVHALENGQLYAAGLDVTDPEPLPQDHPLWHLPRLIVTPHIAATGGDSLRRSVAIAQENLRRYAAGEALLNPVDMVRGY